MGRRSYPLAALFALFCSVSKTNAETEQACVSRPTVPTVACRFCGMWPVAVDNEVKIDERDECGVS